MPRIKKNDAYINGVHFAVAESYKSIRTNLLFLLSKKEGASIITVSSFKAGEGKTTNAINLAIAFSQLGKKVLLIDSDMRRPTIDKKLRIENTAGLSGAIAGFDDVENCIKTVSPCFDVLPAGETPPNPAELLSSASMKELLDSLKPKYDIIVVDTPPIGIVSDPLIVAPLTDGIVVVVKQKESRHHEFKKLCDSVNLTGNRILGVILNQTELGRSYYSYSSKYYQ